MRLVLLGLKQHQLSKKGGHGRLFLLPITHRVIGFEAMPSDTVHAVTLTCHPETPTDTVRGITARVSRTPGGKLAVTYILDGNLDHLRVPASRAPRIADRLWQHTCCEIFIAREGAPAYHEFNLSPSGEWGVYAFDGYRSRRADEPPAEGLAPEVAVRGTASMLELNAVIRLDRLSALHASAPLSLALSVVIEDRDGVLSYWALRHPPGRPDFHHVVAFSLALAAPTTPPARAGTPSPDALHRVSPAGKQAPRIPGKPSTGGER
jgi:hypothetical protein